MTPDMCYRFIIWSYYYHEIVPEKERSYSTCGKFSPKDVKHLDYLKRLLYECFEEASVLGACHQLQKAKEMNETCPFSREELDAMFAHEKK